uniref:Outer membrane protein beta-barrel domain-containing protein n=1 Tax=Leptocylindrus danicus TaxID=163516 RepID=A0A7S2PRS6_9STRA
MEALNIFSEVGFGVGNVLGEEHPKGRAELHLNVLKSYNFGELGLDFSTGGNFIPGTTTGSENNVETLSPNDAKFYSITAFYRLRISKDIFLEPRAGYSSLYHSVLVDDKRTINASNVSYGLGVGTTIANKFSVSLRYQHLGNTPEYTGTQDMTTIISNAEPMDVVLLRVSYRFNWNTIF